MNARKLRPFALAVVFLFVVAIVWAADSTSPTNRPATWAQGITRPGLPNFYQVTTNLYRGAQPTAEGFKQLKAMGIKTVISLREFHSDDKVVTGAGLKVVRLQMSPLRATDSEVVEFLKAATDTNNLPVFVHCERGADRTGTMCAMYRMVVCDWTKEQAIEEMRHGGFEFSPVWRNLVGYIEKADVPALKRRVGLPVESKPDSKPGH